MHKKLLVVGSKTIHTYNFIDLVKDYFDEILLITNEKYEKKVLDFNVHALDFRFKSLSTIVKIKGLVQQFQPTHIHIHQANTYAFFTLMATKGYDAKKVLNAWGSDILINPKKSFFLRQMVKFNLKHADVVVADSDVVLEEAKKLVPNIKTKNINFGIEFLECMEEKENIIYSNRLHKSLYNIDKIIRSFAQFVQKNNDWKLVIAGSGEDTEKLKLLVEKLELGQYVEFIGFVDSVTNFQYYCRAKIYVSIPQSDSVSLSLIEAIVSGCIVFVSDLPANKEVVTNQIGLICKDLEHIKFSDYMNDRVEHKKRAKQLKELFSKSYNKQRYIDIYEN